MSTEPDILPASRVSLRSRRLGKLLFWTAYLAFLYLVMEGTARTYWTLRWKTPFFGTADLKNGRFYPEVRKSGVLTTRITKDDGSYSILFLGGSVLTDDFGDIAPRLRRDLEAASGRSIRIFNCAGVAMTTRDSLIKYREFKSQAFDLLFIYEGLNDVRLNNFPPDRFKADYSHNSWYHCLARLDTHQEVGWTVLPFTFEYLAISIMDRVGSSRYQPRNRPVGGWKYNANEVLTAPSFRGNLTELIGLARQRGAAVFLTTYAWYIPPDYDYAAFKARKLDYNYHLNPVEDWGAPGQVRAGLAVHNRILREVAREQHTLFVDLEPVIPRSRQYFNDVCHLTPDGCKVFVQEIRGPILEQITVSR